MQGTTHTHEVPTELPRLNLTQAELHIPHYTLSKIAPLLWEGSLATEVGGDFYNYLTAPFILDRPSKLQLKSTNSNTWRNVKSSIGQFMGFAHLYMGHEQPRLALYRDHFQTFLAYVSFLEAREVEGVAFYTACSTAKRVLAYLRHSATSQGTPYAPDQEATYAKQVEVVTGVANQLGPIKRNPKADQDQMEAEGGWLDAQHVVYFSSKVVDGAKGALSLAGGAQCMRIGPAAPTAWKVHDALLVAFMFGYLPPIRPSVLISITHPATERVRPEVCKAVGCTLKNCKGNRIMRCPTGYELHLPHHKNGRKWNRKVVHFRLPPELNPLLQAWVEYGWSYLKKGPHVHTLFLNNRGERLTFGSLGTKWKAMLRDAGIQACFPPRRLRHIFVTSRLENPEQPGPQAEHAAVVMGNSVKAWRKHYHTMHEQHGAQTAVDDMKSYRQACLEKLKEKHSEVEALLKEERRASGAPVGSAASMAQALEQLDFKCVGVMEEEEEEEELERAMQLEAEDVMDAIDAGDAEFQEESEQWDEDDDLELDLSDSQVNYFDGDDSPSSDHSGPS